MLKSLFKLPLLNVYALVAFSRQSFSEPNRSLRFETFFLPRDTLVLNMIGGSISLAYSEINDTDFFGGGGLYTSDINNDDQSGLKGVFLSLSIGKAFTRGTKLTIDLNLEYEIVQFKGINNDPTSDKSDESVELDLRNGVLTFDTKSFYHVWGVGIGNTIFHASKNSRQKESKTRIYPYIGLGVQF